MPRSASAFVDGVRPRAWRIALLALLIACASCARPGDTREIALRLAPDAFGVVPDGFHDPVVQIGNEARPVVAAPRVYEVAERRDLVIEDGVARFTLKLADEVAVMPESALVLGVQVNDPSAARDEIEVGAATLHYVRRRSGWHLPRSPSDATRATLEVEHGPAAPGVTLNVRLQAYAPMPTVLTSDPFAAPAGAQLRLGFGLANAPRQGSEAEFAAFLDCEGGATPQRLLARRVATATDGGESWHDALLPLPHGDRRCRLRLEVSADAALSSAPVWAVPIVYRRAPQRERGRRNLVLISLDTLRADHLSAYGYPRDTSPRIDAALAARGAVFADVSTTFPLTSPAHLSLFTGLHPGAMPRTGALDPRTPAPTLAEALRDAGYVTGAYTEDALLAGFFGFWFGFDRFVERPLVGQARGTETFADGARFLRENRDAQFFLFLHTYKVHAPYLAGEAYADLFADPAEWEDALASYLVPLEQRAHVDAYDRAIREADDQVGAFLAELARLGLEDETLVVLLSDHGEAFGEHGLTGHGFGPHQEQLQIPLILRGPGVPVGLRVTAPASIVDVAPTVLELLGVEAFPSQGASLRAALVHGGLDEERLLPFSWLAVSARGARRGRWKLVEAAGNPELFDLASDPHERRPIADRALAEPILAGLARAADDDAQRREVLVAAGSAGEAPTVREGVAESMRALGYIQ